MNTSASPSTPGDSTALPLPPIPFITLIEADHTHVASQARHLLQSSLQPNIPPSYLDNLSNNLIWRLVRHNISEALVMRPAFIRHLGDVGVAMAAEDEADHERYKALVGGYLSHFEGRDVTTTWKERRAVLAPVFKELEGHMKTEVEGSLARFRDVIGEEEGLRLGREYALTLALCPDVEIVTVGVDGGEGVKREKCFPGAAQQYFDASVDYFMEVLDKLKDAALSGRDAGYLLRKVKEEMDVLGLSSEIRTTKL